MANQNAPDERMFPFRNFVPEPVEDACDPSRLQLDSSTLFPILQSLSKQLDELRSLSLLSHYNFSKWCRDLDIPISTTYEQTDALRFWKLGWLRAEKSFIQHRRHRQRAMNSPIEHRQEVELFRIPRGSGRWQEFELAIHPFRIYPTIRILGLMEWHATRSSFLIGYKLIGHFRDHLDWFAKSKRKKWFRERIDKWNGIADLAILLEPLYWGEITSGSQSVIPQIYRETVLGILRRIPKALVAGAHMELRLQASLLDDNHELYLLLRSSNWRKRESLTGKISCAMWLRHMAEVIRRGYDDIYPDKLVHEDEATGYWYPGAREWAYGSEYPLNDLGELVRRTLPRWGLRVGVRVRFYVEGDTEEGAMRLALKDFIGFGIDIINLKSVGWGSRLRHELENDRRARRFSLIMLDGDRSDYLRELQAHARDDLIVGMVFIHRPDFEFGLFTPEKLCRATKYYEELVGMTGMKDLGPDEFDGISTGRDFQSRYCELRVIPSLKGSAWGEALMKVALDSMDHLHPEKDPLIHAVNCAIRSIEADYIAQQKRAKVDPITLTPIDTGELPF